MRNKVYRIIAYGGLGDVVLSTPALKALREKEPGSKIIVYYLGKEKGDIFKNNPYISKAKMASFFTSPIQYIKFYLKLGKFYDFFYSSFYPGLFCEKSAKDLIAEGAFNLELKDTKVHLFLTEEEDKKGREHLTKYNNPVIIHVNSRCSKNQEWPLDNWVQLIQSMPGCTFIQLGGADEHKVEGAIDLRGKTSFREAFAIIKNAKGFVGVNSSLSHVTNAFDIPGVVLFGPSPPVIWGHPNNINLYKPVRCAPCIDWILGHTCPYGTPCMRNITVEDVRNALLQQLKGAGNEVRHSSLAERV